MLRGVSYLCCVVLILLYAAVGQGAQQDAAGVIYTNFGPGMTFDTDQGWTINGPLPVGGKQAIAQKFTPQTTTTFRGAHVVLSLFHWCPADDVSLAGKSFFH